MNLVLAVTTYNRRQQLERLVTTFLATRSKTHQWQLIIADDGSQDTTASFIESLSAKEHVTFIKNNRKGIHQQTNSIIKELEKIEFDLCFKADDDIEFLRAGWDELYIQAIRESGYDHLCHFDLSWRPEKNLATPFRRGHLVSYCEGKDVQGAFYTLTPAVIKSVGYMDTANFGFRGVGHIDYTLRACRAGFNEIDHPFDVAESNDYVGHQQGPYESALDIHLVNGLENKADSSRKYLLIQDQTRIYIPYTELAESLTLELERRYLLKRLDDLEGEKKWYESQFGHQPKWFVRIGKLLFRKVNR